MFSVGDRVYDIEFGWGEVIEIDEFKELPIKVDFKKHGNRCVGYTYDGRLGHKSKLKRLSFSEYTLKGFNQERPPEYMECIGKWGKFWNNDSDSFQIGKLEDCRYLPVKGYRFLNNQRVFQNFKPLTDEQLKVLEL